MRYAILSLVLLFCIPAFAQTPDVVTPSASEEMTAPAAPTDPKDEPTVPEVAPIAPVPTTPTEALAPVVAPPLVVTSEAPLPAVPTTYEAAGTIVGQLLDAAKNGHWTVFGGLVLLILIWLLNRAGLAAKVGKKAVPWVTLGIGVVTAVAVGLAQGSPLMDSLKLGLLEGGIAIALWEVAFKHFLTKSSA